MAGCPDFNIDFTGSASDLVNKMTQEVTAIGGTLTPNDALSGSITITVDVLLTHHTIIGTYAINGATITISISQNGGLPCSAIEAKITGFINGD